MKKTYISARMMMGKIMDGGANQTLWLMGWFGFFVAVQIFIMLATGVEGRKNIFFATLFGFVLFSAMFIAWPGHWKK